MKKRKLYDLPIELLLTIFSAFIYSLSFPSFLSDTGYPILANFALITMIVAINRTKWKYSPLLGFIFGVTFLGIFNYWLSTFHPYAIFIGPIIRGLQLIFLMPLFKLSYHLPKRHKVLFQAIAYTLYTYIIQSGFLGYPYGNLSSAFSTWLPLVQIVSITGQWSISLLMIIPQIFIANYIIDKQKGDFFDFLYKKSYAIIIYVLIVLTILIFGFKTILYYENLSPSSYLKIAAIQHNSDTWKGGYSQYKKNFHTMKDLTQDAMKQNPDLVIWSETAFVPSVKWHTNFPSNKATSKLVESFTEFGKNLSVPLVTGNPEGVLQEGKDKPFDDEGNWNRDDFNSVILFADGKLVDSYQKQHLVPFTEYFPYEKLLPRFYKFLKENDFHWWLPGSESKIFEYQGLKFSTSICFEDIFSDISRKFVKQGSSLLLNLSNDSWSQVVSAEMQHLNLSTYRSIENRRSTVRSTNSGMSCLVTSYGRVISPITPFTADYKIYNVPIYDEEDFGLTFYTKHGDWFIYLLMLIEFSYFIVLLNGKTSKEK